MAHKNRKPASRTTLGRRSQLTLEHLEARQLMAADLVIEWNNATIQAIRSDLGSANPGDGSRVFALVHTAVYDAVNAITKQYSSFALTTEAPSWASKEAAVATAARDVLAGLYPTKVANFNALWQQNLAAIPDGAAENEGVKIGHDAAATILSLRADDGSKGGSNYVTTDGPGHWDVDPLHPNQTVWGPNWGDVSPLAMRYASDFDVGPPPALGSYEYAEAYNEVKSLGSLHSNTRTADQTEIGVFWAYDRALFGPPTVLYNQNVQDIAQDKGNTLEENARLFAMVNVAMADTGVATWKVKFDYDLWRPITAIREGNTDGNPYTAGDPNWIPLGAPGPDPNSTADDFTPPFPAYTSGHAGFGAATFRTLANFYGSDNLNFELTSDELPGVTRNYSSFSEAAEENGRSRIYLGIHWEFDSQQGQAMGNDIADYVAKSMFVPRSNSLLVQLQRQDAGFTTVSAPAGTPIEVRAEGAWLTIVSPTNGEVLYHEPMNEVAAIRIDQRNQATDFVRFIVATGVVMPQTMIVEVVGDQNWFDGAGLITGDTNDLVVLDGDQLRAYGTTPTIYLYGIGFVNIDTLGGGDVLAMHGDQHGRQVNLLGHDGGDWYEIYGRNAQVYIGDSAGNDFFNFTNASSAINLNLAANQGQPQSAAGNTLRFWGQIEHVKATQFFDVVLGNEQANYIEGLGGDDSLYGGAGNDELVSGSGNDLLHGNTGNDKLSGGEGNDIMFGGDGDDYLYGGNGIDFLIAGRGKDWIFGEGGDDLLIGGTTTHDANIAALVAIMNEWTSTRSRSTRQMNIQYGSGTRLNGNYFLKTGVGGTVIEDNEVDVFSKGANDAWVFNQKNDSVRA
jgi:Ca2+-binding RTX toxin-like protein